VGGVSQYRSAALDAFRLVEPSQGRFPTRIAIGLATLDGGSGIVNAFLKNLGAAAMQVRQLVSRCLIGNANAPGEIEEPWPAQRILMTGDVEPFALPEPCPPSLLRRASDDLLIGAGFADSSVRPSGRWFFRIPEKRRKVL
jgi:hypothetical protein